MRKNYSAKAIVRSSGVLAFHDVTEGLNQETALRMMSSFGGEWDACARFAGADRFIAAVGILYGYSDLTIASKALTG